MIILNTTREVESQATKKVTRHSLDFIPGVQESSQDSARKFNRAHNVNGSQEKNS